MNISQEIYFLDTKDFKVKIGKVSGLNLSSTGYILYNLITEEGKKTVESAHVYESAEKANEHTERVKPLIEAANELKDKVTKEIDDYRIQILGEPNDLEFAKQILEG